MSFPSLCFARLRPCSKTSNFLVSHYFLWRNCRMCLPNIVLPVFMFAFIFHCRVWCHFHLAGRQHSLFSRRRALNFHVFLLRNSSPLFSITRFSSFSVIHVSVNIKNDAEKDTTLSLFFLFKSPDGHVISFQIEPWVAFGLPYLLIELFYISMPVVRTDGRAGGRWTVTWLPNFLGWVDYHISLAMGLCAWSSATKEIQGKSTLVRVSARFELARVRAIESQL